MQKFFNQIKVQKQKLFSLISGIIHTHKSDCIYNDLAGISLILGIIFIFFPIGFIIDQSDFWGGRINMYTTAKLYLADIFVVISLAFYSAFVMRNYKNIFIGLSNNFAKATIYIFLLLSILSYFNSIDQTVTFYTILRFSQLTALYFIVSNEIITRKQLIYVALTLISFEAALGIFQFIQQSSGILHFLGESIIGTETKNVAKLVVDGFTLVRSYGTFQHANIFGGIMALGIAFVYYIQTNYHFQKSHLVILYSLLCLALITSFSRSAWLAILIFFIIVFKFRVAKVRYHKIKNIILTSIISLFTLKITGILTFILERLKFNDNSIIERKDQLIQFYSIIKNNPLGIGAGNYTNELGVMSEYSIKPWLFEPVHNVFMVIGGELGILAIILLAYVIYIIYNVLFNNLKNLTGKDRCNKVYFVINALTLIIILMTFDHYLYTNFQAVSFVTIIFALLFNIQRSVAESKIEKLE